jgi:P-type Ca2+ transporter type 2C
MLFSSTVINYGSAIGVVVYTGMNTAIGRVQDEVQKAAEEEEDTPLKKKLNDFGELLTKIIGVICLLVWIMNYPNFSDPIHGGFFMGCIYYFKIAIALAVAAIPEGLPAVITTCLALGTRKMAANNAIIRRLPSVETLGCTTVICSDKTGTLTKNQMCAVKFAHIGQNLTDLKVYDIVEKSYDPQAPITGLSNDFYSKSSTLRDIAVVCSLNNKSSIVYEDGKFNKQGEPTEAALKVFAEKLGQYDNSFKRPVDATKNPVAYGQFLESKLTLIATLDFSSERKTMSTVYKGLVSKDQNSLLLKGAPERVIEKCNSYKKADGSEAQFTQEEKKKLIDQIQGFAKMGLRVLGVGINYTGGKLADLHNGNLEAKLSDLSKYGEYEVGGTFLGFVCIKDPPRDEVKGAIEDCKTAGIRVIMITGDSKETAVSIAKELQIIDSDGPTISFTGTEFEALTPEKKREALSGTGGKVFSRVEPRHKRELVKILIDMD